MNTRTHTHMYMLLCVEILQWCNAVLQFNTIENFVTFMRYNRASQTDTCSMHPHE